jgi:hypothetical protein
MSSNPRQRLAVIIISTVYLGLGLAALSEIHDAVLVGVSYLAISASYYIGHR